MKEKEKTGFKIWFDDKMNEAKLKAHKTVKWCSEHKETIVVFGPVLIGSIIEIAKIASKSSTVQEEKALKERYIYDRSAGHYYEMKRPPKQSEWLMIDQRKNNGEILGEILNDMKLLK